MLDVGETKVVVIRGNYLRCLCYASVWVTEIHAIPITLPFKLSFCVTLKKIFEVFVGMHIAETYLGMGYVIIKLLRIFLLFFGQSWFLVINANSVFGLLHRIVLDNDADVSDVYAVSVFDLEVDVSTLMILTACTCEALALWPPTTWCNNSRTNKIDSYLP
jgi:hypothetical protein